MIDNGKMEKISNELKEYAEVNFQLLKLQTIEKTANLGADFLTTIYIGIIGFITIFFTSLWFASFISTYFNHQYLGYVIVSGVYSLLFISFILFKRRLLFVPFRNRFIRKLSKKL